MGALRHDLGPRVPGDGNIIGFDGTRQALEKRRSDHDALDLGQRERAGSRVSRLSLRRLTRWKSGDLPPMRLDLAQRERAGQGSVWPV